MKSLILAACVAALAATSASAQGPAAPAAPTTPPISAPATGGVVTTPTSTPPAELVKRAKALAKPADRLAVLGLLASGKFPQADSTLAALEAATAIDAGKKEAAKEVAAEFSARADSLQRAAASTLKPLSRGDCVDWASEATTPTEKDLRLEALRIRWHVAPFPKAMKTFETKVAWLVSRPSAGGGSDPEVASLRKEVAQLRSNTEAAFKATVSQVGGLQKAVIANTSVTEEEVVAAVDEMLRTTTFTFDKNAFVDKAPSPADGAKIVLRAGD